MQRVTTDPNDLIESDKEEGQQRTDTIQEHKDIHQNPPSLPSTIKVMKASNSHATSSVPGLSSIMDMRMSKISEENQVLMVKGCKKAHVFMWKFYQKDLNSHFNKDDKTMCGLIMKHTTIRGTQNWWLGMQRIVVKTHIDLCNNAIKNMQIEGEDMK
jgi:hypothetical protein